MRKKILIIFIALVMTFNNISAITKSDDKIYFLNLDKSYQINENEQINLKDVKVYNYLGEKLDYTVDDDKVVYDKAGSYNISIKTTYQNQEYTKNTTLTVQKNEPLPVVEEKPVLEPIDFGTFYNSTIFSYNEEINDLTEIANSLVGVSGECTEVVFMFLNSANKKIINTFNLERIPETEAQIGDIVYYEQMSGWSHVAVYLGNGKALHGNIQGQAQILDVHLEFGSEPIFARATLN